MVGHAIFFYLKRNNQSVFYYIQGRKVSVDEYVTRIRTARNPDLTKRFNTSQYLTHSQVG
jgi:hypothetical protein